jgi:hypothetical protein
LKTRLLKRITVLAVLLGTVMLVFGASTATAAKPCWKQVIDDWWDGRIDGIYSIACMRAAIKNAPEDITQYSDLRTDITRALAERPKVKGRDNSLYVYPSVTEDTNSQEAQKPQQNKEKPRDDERHIATAPVNSDDDAGSGSAPFKKALGAGSSDPSSVPIPLMALGGLALLLLASGATGLVARRVRAHRAGASPPSAGD